MLTVPAVSCRERFVSVRSKCRQRTQSSKEHGGHDQGSHIKLSNLSASERSRVGGSMLGKRDPRLGEGGSRARKEATSRYMFFMHGVLVLGWLQLPRML